MTSDQREDLLKRERRHRYNNSLMTVSTIVGFLEKHCTTVREMAEKINERVVALAQVQSLLDQYEDTNKSPPLTQVIHTICRPYAHEGIRLNLDGPSVEIPPTRTSNLALIINELVINSSKYGALSAEKGHVQVHWSLTDAPGFLSIEWQDIDGPRLSTDPPRSGFGTFFIKTTIEGDGGKVKFKFLTHGLRCTLLIPLT